MDTLNLCSAVSRAPVLASRRRELSLVACGIAKRNVILHSEANISADFAASRWSVANTGHCIEAT